MFINLLVIMFCVVCAAGRVAGRFIRIPLCLAALAGIMVAPLHAAEEIQGDVPLDLVKALLGNNNPAGIRLYSDFPDGFPDITLPDSVELLGSADMGHSQQVVMRAEGDGVRQRAQIMAALEDLDYLMLTQAVGARPEQTGFVTPRFIPPNMPVQYCHDEHGMVTVHIQSTGPMSARSIRGAIGVVPQPMPQGAAFNPFFVSAAGAPASSTSADSVINITRTGGTNNPRGAMMGGSNCAQLQAQFSGRGQARPMMNLSQYMPRMELPAAATFPGMGMNSASTSGSANGMESRIHVSIDSDLDTLFRNIADQISQQDWVNDHEAVGGISATASWTREVDDSQLFGSLRVVSTAESQYQLQFFIQNLQSQ